MIIFDTGEFWIEFHQTTITLVAAGASGRFDISNDRGGRFVGIAVNGGQASLNNGTPVGTRDGTLPDLVYGLELRRGSATARVSVFMRNNDAAAEDQVITVMLFMRR